MNRALDVATSWAASIARVTHGLSVGKLGRRPVKPLEVYEFEGCPFCRLVRDALTALDLEAMVYPCPKGGQRFRPEVERRGGKAQFPYLVDPNTGTEMYESMEIVNYLYREYGDGKIPIGVALKKVNQLGSFMASAARASAGGNRAVPSRAPAKPLELWSFENSPYCRIARTALCELELPYLLHNVAKHSPSRPAFIARSGKMMVPYLADPNTGREMFESADIVRYLHETYGSVTDGGTKDASAKG